MRDWLVLATNLAVDAIDWLALILIVVGAIEAFFQGLWTMFSSPDGHHERDVWLRLGRWLVAGLTFQLAADVLETAITTAGMKSRASQPSPQSAPSSIISSSVISARSEPGSERPKATAIDCGAQRAVLTDLFRALPTCAGLLTQMTAEP